MLLLSIVALLCVFTACGNAGSSQSANTVETWMPQDEQSQQLVQLLSTNRTVSVLFYSADEKFQSIRLGYQYYENGELITDEELGASDLLTEEGKAKESEGLICIMRDEERVEVSASCKLNSFSISDIELQGYKDNDDDYSFAVGELTGDVPFEDGKPVYLVAYYNTEDGETHAYDPQTVMEEPEALKANEKTWLIYAVFSSKTPD